MMEKQFKDLWLKAVVSGKLFNTRVKELHILASSVGAMDICNEIEEIARRAWVQFDLLCKDVERKERESISGSDKIEYLNDALNILEKANQKLSIIELKLKGDANGK